MTRSNDVNYINNNPADYSLILDLKRLSQGLLTRIPIINRLYADQRAELVVRAQRHNSDLEQRLTQIKQQTKPVRIVLLSAATIITIVSLYKLWSMYANGK